MPLTIEFCDCLKEKLEWGKYVSPVFDRKQPPFNWYSFKHSYSSELVSKVFSMFGINKGDVIFDPFCGGGTTLIQAKLMGYNSIGLDISPFPVFLTNVLTTTYDTKKLKESFKIISYEIDSNISIPDVDILKKAFSNKTLNYIFSLKKSINSFEPPYKDFFLFSLLSILNDVSKAKKSGGFLRITEQKKQSRKTIQRAFIDKTQKLIDEADCYQFSNCYANAFIGDARNYPSSISEKSFDAILTSPPYPNRHDYTRIYALELLIGFIDDNPTLKSLRYNTLRSHVEAKKQYDTNHFIIPNELEEIIAILKEKELNNPQIVDTLYGYFEDIYLCLREMKKVLKINKYIGLVVSNVRFAGVMIPVDELLGEIGEQVGLSLQEIFILRYRGNSSQQMAKYERQPCRETLIIWKNGN